MPKFDTDADADADADFGRAGGAPSGRD